MNNRPLFNELSTPLNAILASVVLGCLLSMLLLGKYMSDNTLIVVLILELASGSLLGINSLLILLKKSNNG